MPFFKQDNLRNYLADFEPLPKRIEKLGAAGYAEHEEMALLAFSQMLLIDTNEALSPQDRQEIAKSFDELLTFVADAERQLGIA